MDCLWQIRQTSLLYLNKNKLFTPTFRYLVSSLKVLKVLMEISQGQNPIKLHNLFLLSVFLIFYQVSLYNLPDMSYFEYHLKFIYSCWFFYPYCRVRIINMQYILFELFQFRSLVWAIIFVKNTLQSWTEPTRCLCPYGLQSDIAVYFVANYRKYNPSALWGAYLSSRAA